VLLHGTKCQFGSVGKRWCPIILGKLVGCSTLHSRAVVSRRKSQHCGEKTEQPSGRAACQAETPIWYNTLGVDTRNWTTTRAACQSNCQRLTRHFTCIAVLTRFVFWDLLPVLNTQHTALCLPYPRKASQQGNRFRFHWKRGCCCVAQIPLVFQVYSVSILVAYSFETSGKTRPYCIGSSFGILQPSSHVI
jgi:hypothetical protein